MSSFDADAVAPTFMCPFAFAVPDARLQLSKTKPDGVEVVAIFTIDEELLFVPLVTVSP